MAKKTSTKKPKKAPKTPEQKAANFVKVGQKRFANAVSKLRLLRNLANRASYEFTEEQVAAIGEALTAEVEAIRVRFEAALSAPTGKVEADIPKVF